jgi:hypothetical protein
MALFMFSFYSCIFSLHHKLTDNNTVEKESFGEGQRYWLHLFFDISPCRPFIEKIKNIIWKIPKI